MAEYETTNQEPRNYDAVVYESLEPEPAPDPEAFGSNHTEIERAAEELSGTRAERNQVIERQFHDGQDFTKVAPGNKTVSPEYAADKLKEIRELEQQVEGWDRDAALQKEIDALRAGDTAQPQTPDQTQPQAPEIQPEYATEPDALDNLLNSVPDENTRRYVKQGLVEAYSKQQAEIEQARQAAVAHANAAAAALEQRTVETLLVAEQAALAPFPELANVRREDMQVGLNHIRQTNPQRFEEIDRHVARVKGLAANQLQAAQLLHQQQQQASHAQQAYAAQQFREYAELHDSKTLVDETPETRKAIESALIEGAEREGIDKETLVQIWNSNPVARHSYFQNLIADGVKWRLAKSNIPQHVARPVARVQRPGVSEPAADRSAYADFGKTIPRQIVDA